MKNEDNTFDFWKMYEKFVGFELNNSTENSEAEKLKKALMEGGMADISFHAAIEPFARRQKQERSLRNMIEAIICCDKIEDFDYDQYYNQYLQKQNKENKELPLTYFVDMLINEKKIPALNYKEYQEQVLNQKINSEEPAVKTSSYKMK